MKAVIEAYTGLAKLAPLVRDIGWNHNLVILERFKDPLELEFYLRVTRNFSCSGNEKIFDAVWQGFFLLYRRGSKFPRHLIGRPSYLSEYTKAAMSGMIGKLKGGEIMHKIILSAVMILALAVSAFAGDEGGYYSSYPQNQYQTYGTPDNSYTQGYSPSTGNTWSSQSYGGSQSGINSQGQSWSYDRGAGVYHNYGTGETRYYDQQTGKQIK